MSQDMHDDWIAFLLPAHRNREIARVAMLDRNEFELFGMPKPSIRHFSIGWDAPPREHPKSSKNSLN
jgi:hypothetical protein